ncbi:response regulator transcription factor [Fusobacterium mortiferum]|jgi:DNA-binding response OmpR family regulator|uniref:DNA-binding response regulator n=1 Tax=Fusobacterium mortiferum ATCC 9817 TaxID=469616 RepID=A0ABM6TXE6_FUSMR|nr:response regulator transcription factor [Fusobacterium mortiferum]AVQ18717.1 DNA-binding response regulator [Fusobacterium mortiferum ATCC 9817]EEO34960.1 putative transcriptional regulatory protein WalR [Fusobacterium mortiferum ATCC 9817]MCF2627646.1 response regulator transcription factor [Fusobacterium mortiferum]MCF2699131.1 response regulator transcription factor [Fusobacterium mortiferum]MCI7664715.1 response regulator transcription factor [Fusobacterium mortiferum]
MKRKILIIEDEKPLAQVLEDTFSQEGFEIIKAFDGENGVDKFYNEKPDLILLDINLPKKLGWEVCKEIRETSNIPIIMMTARDSDSDEYNGLSIGADDYITKPFNLKILLLKVKKLLKLDDNNIYKFENFSFDIKKGEITINGENSELTRREIQFLEYMIKNKGIIFSRDYLLNEIWGFDFEGDDRVVDTLVKRIRKKLGDYSFLLKTIRGMGYSFDENKN